MASVTQVNDLRSVSYLDTQVLSRLIPIVSKYAFLLHILAVCMNFLFGVCELYFASNVYSLLESSSENLNSSSLSFTYSCTLHVVRI